MLVSCVFGFFFLNTIYGENHVPRCPYNYDTMKKHGTLQQCSNNKDCDKEKICCRVENITGCIFQKNSHNKKGDCQYGKQLDGFFCRKGCKSRRCPPGYECKIHNYRRFGVCCPSVTCPHLADPMSGRVILNGNTPKSTATYSCNAGFYLSGNDKRTCMLDGKWSGSAPVCNQITCPSLADPMFGQVILNANTPNSTATYSCNEGFYLSGNDTRTCMLIGKWSGSAPVCNRITCPDLDGPTNGLVSMKGNTPNSTATYSCKEGFDLSGTDTRTCMVDGKWSGSAPVCNLVTPSPWTTWAGEA